MSPRDGKPKAPTWRDGVIAAAASAKAREVNARASATRPMGVNTGEDAARAHAYNVIAEELAYIASLPAHEGLARLRKLGTDASRTWAAEYARTGFSPKEPQS